MKAFLTNTLLSGQLYKRPPSQIPVFLKSHTNSIFFNSRNRPAPVMDTVCSRPPGARSRELLISTEPAASSPFSCERAARKVAPDWSQKIMTRNFNCFSIFWGQGLAPLVTSLPSNCYMTLSIWGSREKSRRSRTRKETRLES